MKTYDSYKDSGIEWIGEIPNHWKAIPMRFLLRRRITDGPHETPKFLPDVVPFLSVDGIQDGELVFEGCRKISEEDHEKYKQKCVVEKHDILMGKAASVGKVAQVKVDFEFSIWSPLALLKPNHDKITSAYFEYFLKSTYAKDNANILSTFNTQQNISMTDIPRIYYVIPNSVEEQTAIANYLDCKTTEIDELIADKKRLLELYEEEKSAVINQAVTKGLDPNSPMKDSGIEWLGEIPKHWEVKRVKHLFTSMNHIRIPLSADERGKMNIRIYDYYGASGVIDKVEDFLFSEPLLLIGEDGANLVTRNSRLSFIAKGKYWVNNHAHILKNRTGSLEYFCELLELCDYTNWITGSAQPKLTSENLMNIQIVVPPEIEQYEIMNFLDIELLKINKSISKTQKLIDLLTEYRTVLISEVVTGKVKVID